MSDGRPNPDALLARVASDEASAARGKLKIFFGAAPGVGKTYAMLEAGRKLAKEGLDVVVGYVEPHVRPDTQALVLGLDVLPRRSVEYHGRTIQEFDLDGALTRHPQLLLVDELAHTNAPGSTHAKRWQDVEQLLAAGINVFTTLNVQHVESLNDVVAQVTTVPVRETVPDHVYEQAAEVELVDIAPDDLIDRLREGKVYVPDQARRAIENFFRKGNLIALRELSLRKTAERVGAQTLDYRNEHEVARIWATSERLLVCVGSGPGSARLVRSARRMASGLRAPWTALHVEVDGRPTASEADRARLEEHLRLAEELGATIAVTSGSDFASAILHYGRENNVTKIIVGKPRLSRWREWLRGTYVADLIRASGDIDVYVINGEEAPAKHQRAAPESQPASRWPYVLSAAIVGICSLIAYPLSAYLAPTNLVMVYLAGVIAAALLLGRGPSILAAVAGVAVFDFVYVPPYGTFVVDDAEYLFTFFAMLATGVIVSELTTRVRLQTAASQRRERRTAALLALSRELAEVSTREAVAQVARRIVQKALDVDVWVIAPFGDGGLRSADFLHDAEPPPKDAGVVKWVFEHRAAAGHGTDTLPGGEGTYLPLLTTSGIVGVLGARPQTPGVFLDVTQMQLLQAFAGQVAGAMERCALAVEAEHVRMQMETERLRNSLLSTVSHDLRTPLATITGAAGLLVEEEQRLPQESRHELALSIVDEADRLNRLVGNLLDLTKLEAGALRLDLQPQPIEEVIGIALKRMERLLVGRSVDVEIPDGLPPVAIDALLIQQVLVNLIDNACKFSPASTPIELSAAVAGDMLAVSVADRGQGLTPGTEQRLFEKFFRADGHSRTGSGIGLAICRGIVELHGGRIIAEQRPGGGALFRFTVPLARSISL
ncbi:MAG: two-component system sensor histidine kinase KdbD [Pirellula sp.]|nr:two-component system sensor histidine kinase KdbD [Pirellula sp.]